MTLSWNEIKDRALNFSKEWVDTSNEEADAKPFLVEFFKVFGITSKRVSTFEHRVKKLNDKDGYIDLLWKGMILIEMKSRGKNLDRAFEQAKDYLHGLKEHELPKYILISDFENFRLHDLEETKNIAFKLNDLVINVQHFGYLLGYQKKVYKEQDPANIKAAELMGKLHDRLEEIGYTGHPLEVYLVRLLFLMFAEDTTIFEKQQFQEYIEQRTNIDGSDLAAKLQELFQVLNTPKDSRFKNLDEQLADFPYVNGKLFEENLPTASFDSKMRQALLDCTYIDWSKISPAIFGSMFQSVMNPTERRNLGAHYTSETNILKLIKPLFLDDLWKEFENIKDNKNKLGEFHKKISTYHFLDPACGCGNFLIITYRELRLLELEVLRVLNKSGQRVIDVSSIILIDVDQFYGIEYEEFPARIAEVAMWLIDHQMNMIVSNEFGQYFVRLPLKKAAQIRHADALETDWESVVTKNDLSFIIGNPPFIGHQWRNDAQKKGMEKVFGDSKRAGRLDYVTAWYLKAAQLIQGTKIKVAFVSTNSIVQGEQTSILWEQLFKKSLLSGKSVKWLKNWYNILIMNTYFLVFQK
jgi:type I restriction-modification system DNA methylase subunit